MLDAYKQHLPALLFIFYELQTSQSQKPFQTNIIFICARLFHYYFSLCLLPFFLSIPPFSGKTIKTFAALGCILSELACVGGDMGMWGYGD